MVKEVSLGLSFQRPRPRLKRAGGRGLKPASGNDENGYAPTPASFAPVPIGQDTPVPPRPQYPNGFLARYCW